jgi:C4-dicarboxylate transporter DctM subunit
MFWLFLFIFLFFLFAFLRIPIAFGMGMSAAIIMALTGIPHGLFPPVSFASLDQFPFLAVPFFLYSGDLMVKGKISQSLLRFTETVVGRIRGSLGATVVIGSMLFGTVSGSSVATVSAIGTVMMPELLQGGYNRRYATALISVSGFLGILIPPSVPGIIYAISAGLPVADVWISTVGAGVLVGGGYILLNYLVYGRSLPRHRAPFVASAYLRETGRAFLKAIWGILMPVIIFGGVYGGICTPTEAGAVAVVYGIVILAIVLRNEQNPLKKFLGLTQKTAINSGAICIILAFASVAGRMIVSLRIPEILTVFITQYTTSPIVFLLMVNGILLILGTFMETNTSILITAPILVPVAKSFNIDPIHFGAILLLNLEIGMITPPFAANLFVGCRIGNISMDQVIRPLLPFFLVLIPVLLVVTYIPSISLFLVHLLAR